jgi:hypothetical protein
MPDGTSTQNRRRGYHRAACTRDQASVLTGREREDRIS